MHTKIIRARSNHSEIVAALVGKLLKDLVGHKGQLNSEKLAITSEKLLSANSGFYAFLFQNKDAFIGVITVSRSAAIYAGGYFGEIEELYVEPDYRSRAIGKALLDHVICFAQTQEWSRLEVSTPEREKWQRTIEFYRREGFSGMYTGDRLKLEI